MMPRFKTTLLVALACLTAGGPSAKADDWPLVRADEFGTGVARSALADDLDVVWKYSAGKSSTAKDAGFDATPVIADGVIYIGDSAGTFHADRLADGQRVWTKDFADSGFAAGAALGKGLIDVGDVIGIARPLNTVVVIQLWSHKLVGEV